MTIAHFDPAAGASGDMILGALIDAGADLEQLRAGLAALAVEGWTLTAEPVTCRGLAATRARVELADVKQPHRHLHHLERILDESALSQTVRERAKAVFRRLATAEAAVHRTTLERVHFHEVGAVDAIVDIVGSLLALELLGVERVTCGPLPVSHGWVDCAHGRLPVPAPATLELLRGLPTRPLDVEGETLTPTGAALLGELADSFAQPAMTLGAIGCGAGSKDYGLPNVLRVWLGEVAPQPTEVLVVEANLDDMNPEWYELALERIFAAGALDVTLQPVQMKKSRPGVLLRAVCEQATLEAVAEAILRETTTLGVRWFAGRRLCVEREWRQVDTAFGPVRVKIGRRGARVWNIAPEYASCREVAEAADASLASVYAAAQEAARVALSADGPAPKG